MIKLETFVITHVTIWFLICAVAILVLVESCELTFAKPMEFREMVVVIVLSTAAVTHVHWLRKLKKSLMSRSKTLPLHILQLLQ